MKTNATIVTIVLLGVLIPIFQAAQAKNSNIRDQLSVRVAVFDDATGAEIQDLRGKLLAVPHVKSVQFIDKKEALAELKAKGKTTTGISAHDRAASR